MPDYVCSVWWVGPQVDSARKTRVFLGLHEKNGAFSEMFVAAPEQAKEILATALTAYASGSTVKVGLTGTSPSSEVYQLFIGSF